MTYEKIVEYLEAVKLSQSNHMNQNNSAHRCPACGNTLTEGNKRPSSVLDGLFVCSDCQSNNNLDSWWIIRLFEKHGAFPSDIHFTVIDPEVNDDKTITFVCECWFRWEKFGVPDGICEIDNDTWINVYVTVNPATNEVFMEYTIDDNDKNESFVFVLNQEDREAVLAVIETYCKQRGETLQEIVDSVLPATEEQEFEIPVKEINYGVAKIRAASLEAALEKVTDAYGTGQIEWSKTEFDFTIPMGGVRCA